MICALFCCFFCMLIGFDSLHHTESIRKVIFQVNMCTTKLKFCKFAGGENINMGPTYKILSKINIRGWHIETCLVWGCGYFPLTRKGLQGEFVLLLLPSLFMPVSPWSFSCLALSLDKGLTLGHIISHSCHGALGFSRQRAVWPGAMWVHLTGDAACHSIPLSPDQLRPRWLCSFPVPGVKYGRLYHGRWAHKTYFQDEWKPSHFFLLYPFLFVFCSSACLFLPDIFLDHLPQFL